MTDKRILVVDDEQLIRWSLQKNLEKAGYAVVVAETGEEALEKIKEEAPDLVLLDFKLPGMNGFEVLEKTLALNRAIVPVMLTASEDVDSVVKAMRLGAFDYITKPFDFQKVLLSVEKAFDTLVLKREVSYLRREQRVRFGVTELVGASAEIKRILEMTRKVAKSEQATVLIQGESGTGKEYIAHAIHYQSKRENMAFVAVNCAGLSENLLENDLCGHERGAFTDARELKKGLLEVADGGSLFLDEIGDMSAGMQAKLLRLIEQKTFRRMGGVKDITVDVRIITATNKDLRKLVEEGKFREDLFYRINIVAIHIPPLRERRDDILPLASYFVQKYDESLHKSVRTISKEVESFLLGYEWPGNVRELRNVIERAMILGEGNALIMEHLPRDVVQGPQTHAGKARGFRIPPEGISMERVEEDFVKQALEMTGRNQTKAAKLLGISRDSLRYRMQKLGIE